MKHCKKILVVFSILFFAYSLQPITVYGQSDTSTVDKRKIDSLANVLLEAHRTFKKLSDEVFKQAETPKQKAFAAKTDSIFKARRGVINALLNNIYLLPEDQRKTALENFQSYLFGAENANKMMPKIDKSPYEAAAGFAQTMRTSNEQVRKNLNFTLPAEGNVAFEVRPDNFLTMNISYAAEVKKTDFIIFLFPSGWINKPNRLANCYMDNWNNMCQCANINLTHSWSYGDDKKLNYLFSGAYSVVLYNKTLNKATPLKPVIVPISNSYTYTVNP